MKLLQRHNDQSVSLKIPVLVATLLLTGCTKEYTIRIMSESDKRLERVVVHYGNLQSSFGVVIPDSLASKAGYTVAPPDEAIITWSDDTGERSVAVDLSVVPNNYHDGVLTFVIEQDSTVRVGFFKR